MSAEVRQTETVPFLICREGIVSNDPVGSRLVFGARAFLNLHSLSPNKHSDSRHAIRGPFVFPIGSHAALCAVKIQVKFQVTLTTFVFACAGNPLKINKNSVEGDSFVVTQRSNPCEVATCGRPAVAPRMSFNPIGSRLPVGGAVTSFMLSATLSIPSSGRRMIVRYRFSAGGA